LKKTWSQQWLFKKFCCHINIARQTIFNLIHSNKIIPHLKFQKLNTRIYIFVLNFEIQIKSINIYYLMYTNHGNKCPQSLETMHTITWELVYRADIYCDAECTYNSKKFILSCTLKLFITDIIPNICIPLSHQISIYFYIVQYTFYYVVQ
jgi:hypothetical protein